ncbi:MAG: DUF2236 domain-containing protein [Deltaproteobacteria bacterium]|nr:MAG: DUF2236 domain-containing protein [Deltaproteobacteria bacterium]
MTPVSMDRLGAAIDRSTAAILANPLPNGGWQQVPQLAPAATALVHLILKQLGHTRPSDDKKVCTWILRQQLPDGSFPSNLHVGEGSLVGTAACWAALSRSGLAEDDPRLAQAWDYVLANGGLDAVAEQALSDPYATAPYLGYAGILDADKLPKIPLAWIEVPGALHEASKVINAGVLTGMLQLGTIFTGLRGGSIGAREKKAIIDFCANYQSRNGAINGIALMTVMWLCALRTLGEGPGNEHYDLAVSWLAEQRVENSTTLYYNIFGSDVWDTALNLRALLVCDVDPTHPAILGGVKHLYGAQQQTELPPTTPDRGPKLGGFGYEYANNSCPDNDDTGVAMGALSMFLQRSAKNPALEDIVNSAADSCEQAREYLIGMQNKDGGWGAYEQGQPGKLRGPMWVEHAALDWTDPKKAMKDLRQKVATFGDPSTEDVTARILEAWGRMDATPDDPRVKSAIEFLVRMQEPDGSWWSRWMTNYVAGTAWCLIGLTSVGCENKAMLDRGVQFLVGHQNKDGGWGEGIDSYVHPEKSKAQGESMPGLTGLALSALCRAGHGQTDAAHRAAAYLVKTQRKSGTWANKGWQHVFLLPGYFYWLPASDTNMPLEALGHYRHAQLGLEVAAGGATTRSIKGVLGGNEGDTWPTASVRNPDGTWSQEGLRAWRTVGDPSADAVVRKVMENHQLQQVSDVFRHMVTNDDPFPPDVDPELAKWLEDNANLPEWADHDLIRDAQAFYERVGWSFALCLFASSLPQAYAAANGARVLLETQGLTQHVKRRIGETAQFLFDVLAPDSFGPKGRGLAVARKVRLIHATVRQHSLMRRAWATPSWGVPINQEDLAGTVMTFSLVVLDAMKRLHIHVSPHEEKAWMHTWACVGHVMGVHENLLAPDIDDARALMDAIRDDQWAPSEQGRRLTHQLCWSIADMMPAPTNPGVPMAEMLIREVAGDRCADVLGLPKYAKRRAIIRKVLHVQSRIANVLELHHRHPRYASVPAYIATAVMEALILVEREGKQTTFRLPDALVHRWGLMD